MDEVEALARAYCREMGYNPDERGIVETIWARDIYKVQEFWSGTPAGDKAQWEFWAHKARQQLAWSRAMEAVKRDG